MGNNFRGPPGALLKCSTSQPRLRAIAASRVSGFTATGKPTASSIGRSDAESAYATDSASERRSASRNRRAAGRVTRRWAARRSVPRHSGMAHRPRRRRKRRADDVVEERRAQRLHDEVERARDQQRAMADGACSRTRRMAAGNDFVRMRSLNISTSPGRVGRSARPRSGGRSAEGSRRDRAGPSQQPWRLRQRARDETQALVRRQSPRGEPCVGGDHVRAMSVFSRSKAARCRSGASTCGAAAPHDSRRPSCRASCARGHA